MYRIPSETLNRLINEINKEEIQEKLKKSGINDARLKLLTEVINGRVDVSYPDIWDIEQYALKLLLPEEYKSLALRDHCYSSSELYEYDPPKNGQNIIKHGLSFGKVVSYSKKFGTLLVPCPDEQDGERVVIFSDILLRDKNFSLSLDNIDSSKENYTLSIAQSRNGKFRFISSRLLSKNSYKENMDQAFRNIYKENKEYKNVFVDRCVEIIERDLLKTV
jgi:hypothetical protein